VNTDTLTEIKVGDQVETSDGVKVTVHWFSPPHKESSQGKVGVRPTGSDSRSQEFYASVIGAEYQHEGDAS
jgi:hypothetical protein